MATVADSDMDVEGDGQALHVAAAAAAAVHERPDAPSGESTRVAATNGTVLAGPEWRMASYVTGSDTDAR